MGDTLEYPDVVQEIRGAMNPGRLKLQNGSIIFKNIKTGKVDQFQASELESAQWLVRARGNCLKLILKSGYIHRFDGFKDTDQEKLSSFFSKQYDLSLDKKDLSLKGWNWGVATFEGNGLEFEVDGKTAFEIPLGNVSHSMSAKSEVTIEFHQNDDAAVSLMELRFHIPSDPNSEKDPVQEFHKNVLAKADIIQATGDAITIFPEVQCLTPRGRYDIKIYPTFLQLHGKTFDYKIPYTTILRLFLLPHRDNRQMFFVVSLDPPIKQGQTRYHFLILLFNKEEETTLELGLSEDDIQEKYDGKLAKEMSGPMYEIVSRVMKTLVNRKITVPGSFVGHSGTHSIACSYKAATGFLYPLERGFIFVHKPPIHIRFDEIDSVNFARSAGSTRSFDFDVATKSTTVFTFVGIEKDEYGKLFDFVKGKKLRVKNVGGKLDPGRGGGAGYNADDMVDSDDDEEHDAYLERMKAEGKEREDDEDEESDDESDVSFNPGDASGSEVAEEYDTDAASSSDSDEEGEEGGDDEEAKKRKEKKKKEKEKRKTKTIKEPGTRKKRKTKKVKDADKPKRPQSAYFLWLNEHREQIKSENPGISITDISRKAGEMWKEVKDKSRWEKLAEKAKADYAIAMEQYQKKKAEEPDDDDDEEASSTPKKKRSKKSNKSPAKSPGKESKAGSGADFKSKEFISSSGSSSSSSDDDKPLKKKAKKEKAPKRGKKKEKEEEIVDELPEDEEILSTPEASDQSGSEAGSDED